MKQNIFETQQRAKELIHQAMNIWKDSDQSQNLEGLENDPVFSVIMSAIAYQANELDNEIQELKDELFQDFEKTMSVGASGNAVPATVVIRTNASGTTPVEIDSRTLFGCGGEENFMPVLRSRVFNIQDMAVSQMDGRRWKVALDFHDVIDNLDRMTFAIAELPYHSLSVSLLLNGEEIPLEITTPWDSANLPMTEPFSLDTLMYNRMYCITDSGARGNLSPYNRFAAMDLYAKQDLTIFMLRMRDMDAAVASHFSKSTHIELCFEFDGMGEQFIFNKSQIAFNALLLANVRIRTAALTGTMPIARLNGGHNDEDFIHMLRPDKDQVFSSAPVAVRRIATDRFSQSKLVKHLTSILEHYSADYHAFMQMDSTIAETHIQRIMQSLKALLNLNPINNVAPEGIYAMLPSANSNSELSLTIRYLTTSGARLQLSQDMSILVPKMLEQDKTYHLVPPQEGLNAIRDSQAEMSLKRYLVTTNDRLVTMADIKLFCYTELQNRYSLVRDIISDISIKHERFDEGSYHTYCIMVRITLTPNNFVKRAFANKTEIVESYLQKMIQVRSSGIYPVKVKIYI